jgi:alkylhydroperoxidase/carboxymuconolactone decarboxylase family protein YurZ
MSDTARPTSELTVQLVREAVLQQVAHVPEGAGLDEQTRALVELCVRACATTLDLEGTRVHVERALESGLTPTQVQEALLLISGIGLHCLLATSGIVADVLQERGDADYLAPLTPAQEELRAELVGDGAREANTARVAPGFLDNVVRLMAPEVARAVYAFRAAPFSTEAITPLQKELVGIAVDTMPSHRFLPTLRLHVDNAVRLGAGLRTITEVLDVAGAAPPHRGVW